MRLSLLLYRNATIKASAYLRACERYSNNFVYYTEVLVQRRRQSRCEAIFTYKQFLCTATLYAYAAYRRCTVRSTRCTHPKSCLMTAHRARS